MTQFTTQARANGQNTNIDYRDVAEKVIQKLTVLYQFFEFYQYTKGMAGFCDDTISGLSFIIDDCITEFKNII